MKNLDIKGIITPIITPFTSDSKQDVNEPILREVIDYQLKGGVHGIFTCGSNGEGLYLSHKELKKVTKITVDHVNGKVPVIAGIQTPDTRTAIELSNDAKDVGADAIVVLAPYYFQPTRQGIINHYKQISVSVEMPIMIYNMPRFSSYDLSADIVSELAKIENVVAIKDSSKDLLKIAEEIKLCKNRINVLIGSFTPFFQIFTLGGHGCITGFNNILPRLHVDMLDEFQKGNAKKAREIYNKILPLALIGPNPVNVKAAFNIIGLNVGSPRKPLLPADSSKVKKISKILENLKLI